MHFTDSKRPYVETFGFRRWITQNPFDEAPISFFSIKHFYKSYTCKIKNRFRIDLLLFRLVVTEYVMHIAHRHTIHT